MAKWVGFINLLCGNVLLLPINLLVLNFGETMKFEIEIMWYFCDCKASYFLNVASICIK